MRTDAQRRAENKSKKKIYEQMLIKSRREVCLNERIERAAAENKVSKNAYVIAAIEKQLAADGFGALGNALAEDASDKEMGSEQ